MIALLLSSVYFSIASVDAATRNWDYSVVLAVTRCYETKDVKVYCEGEGEKPVVQELQIEAKDFNGDEYAYIYGKAIEGNLCQKHLRRIKSLMRNANQACITGDGENKMKSGEVILRWRAFETRKGEIVW
jgi:hypothetical protein